MVLTRRAHRARMRITLWLPNEVLTEIIRHARKSDQAALCRVSKLFHGLVLPILNRTIVLLAPYRSGGSSRLELAKSFIDNPDRADAVRTLTIMFTPSETPDAQIHHNILFESLKLMKKLESLIFSTVPEQAAMTRLAGLSFPNLLKCRIMVPHDGSAITKFLTQHPSIICLHAIIYPSDIHHPFEPGQTFLPNLRYYEGPTALIQNFASQSLHTARLLSEIELAASDVQALKALTNPALPFVLTVVSVRFSEAAIQTMLSVLSATMSYIQNLHLRTPEGSQLNMETFNHITAELPQLTRIEYFSFTQLEYQNGSGVDTECFGPTFRTWAAASPTLKGCCIGQMAWKKIGERWEQCTREEFSIVSGLSALDRI